MVLRKRARLGSDMLSRSGSRNSSHSRLDVLFEAAEKLEKEHQSHTTAHAGSGCSSRACSENTIPLLKSTSSKRCRKPSELDLYYCDLQHDSKPQIDSLLEAVDAWTQDMEPETINYPMEACGENDAKRKRTERLSWTGKLQERFLAAVNHLGVDSAVPKDILLHMNVDDLTREQVASHLQKYRQHVKREKVQSSEAHSQTQRGSYELMSQQSTAMPGHIVLGLPVDLPLTNLKFLSRYSPLEMCAASKACTEYHGKIPLPGQIRQLDASAWSNIKEFAAGIDEALKAEFTYPSGPPVFVSKPAEKEGQSLLEIKPLITDKGSTADLNMLGASTSGIPNLARGNQGEGHLPQMTMLQCVPAKVMRSKAEIVH